MEQSLDTPYVENLHFVFSKLMDSLLYTFLTSPQQWRDAHRLFHLASACCVAFGKTKLTIPHVCNFEAELLLKALHVVEAKLPKQAVPSIPKSLEA